jgi:hypothetical protein
MPTQMIFLTQYLTMKQPRRRNDVNQGDPIRQDEKLADQNDGKGHVNWVAAECENAVRYQSIRMVCVDANPKALPEGKEAPQ